MSFHPEVYRAACAAYATEWAATDAALYALCRQHPDHQDLGSINAKLWIIGRTYATGIERKIPTKKTQGSSMEQLSAHLWANRVKVDELLSTLRPLAEPLTPATLTQIISIYAGVVAIVQGVLRKGQTPRSFVSKYLHFHNPVVPIFDSVAVSVARKYYPLKAARSAVHVPASFDHQYSSFIQRFWRLYQDAQQTGIRLNVKLLDNYLLALAKKAKTALLDPLTCDFTSAKIVAPLQIPS